ncbi:MAG: alkylphosphonate utilization protein [Spirochaetia bacterium]|nr:alkylphosphonate utilization protein [Spirochaetia bacterium]
MSDLPKCPKCQSADTYDDGTMYGCPHCGHEWDRSAANTAPADSAEEELVVRDAHGNVLQAGDNVTVIKDLKVKGSSSVLKIGTKAKIVRLVDGDHNLDCRVDRMGAMGLKSEFVKKA